MFIKYILLKWFVWVTTFWYIQVITTIIIISHGRLKNDFNMVRCSEFVLIQLLSEKR